MELGRECMALWGYEYIDELVWVKTNQLQRIIRTGRTGHWLNHGKEHCLVGYYNFSSYNFLKIIINWPRKIKNEDASEISKQVFGNVLKSAMLMDTYFS